MAGNRLSIAVLGATGATGRLVLDEALRRGHQVTAFVRDAAKLSVRTAALEVRTGDALNARSLSEALRPGQRLISCLGIGPRGPQAFHSRSARAILSAAASVPLSRIVVQSSLGTGSSAHARTPALSTIFWMMRTSWILDDKAEEERLFLGSALSVTIVQPGLLSNGPFRGDVRIVSPAELPRLGFIGPVVPRANVAAVLVDQAEISPQASDVFCLVRQGALWRAGAR